MTKWVALKGAELEQVVEILAQRRNAQVVSASVRRPSFYRNGLLLKLTADGVSRLFIGGGSADLKDMQFYLLDGRSMPIHDGNNAAGIDIRTAEEAERYLRFFCSILRTEVGRFNILDALPCGCDADALGEIGIGPPEVFEDEDGCFAATACVEYAGDLFMADFKVWPNGVVEMTEDYPLGPAAPRSYSGVVH